MDRRGFGAIIVLVAGIYAVVCGALAFSAWALNIPRLADWINEGIYMFPNTAVCAMLCGAALLLTNARPSGRFYLAVRLLAILVSLIGGLTLVEHITGIDLGIDRILFERPWGQRASASPMRMGLPASISYTVFGIAFLLASSDPRARRIASFLAILPVLIASLSLTGYWFGADQLFGIAKLTGIAWQTSTVLAMLGIGLVSAIPEHGFAALLSRDDAGGVVARKLLLPIVLIPFLLGWLRVLGQDAGLYDTAFGTAVRTVLEIIFFLGLLWWTANSISEHSRSARVAEQALRTSEERFMKFMQSLPGLAWIKDTSGRYVYANDAAVKSLARSREELYGHMDAEFFPPETAGQFVENDRKALASESGVQVVETLTRPDGVTYSWLVSKFPIMGADRKPALVGGIAIDITDRMRAEQALREADRRKDEFLAMLSHELRNPLAPIRNAVNLLKERAMPDPEMEWIQDVIERQVSQMSRLLDDLLDVSRISHNKLELRRERVELSKLVLRAIETSRPFIDLGGHALNISLPSRPIWLDADPVRLAQVFSNLLNNAAKYTEAGGRIQISADRDGGDVLVKVSDNGIGIAPGVIGGIFDTFSQSGRAREHSQSGLGVGLSLVRTLLHLHGGSISAFSDGLGMGSEFIVRLPILDEEISPTHPEASDPLPQVGARHHVLIADDLRDNADSLSLLLKLLGHEVQTAYDGEEALALAQSLRPDVILLDIGMPKLDGHEVCRAIRAEPWGRSAFLVAITGWGQEDDRRRTAEAGFDHHLTKPVDLAAITALISALDSRKG